jgi:plasmid maintenance system antidote protein VapI
MIDLREDLIENYNKFPAKYFAEKYNKKLSTIYDIVCELNISKGPKRTESLSGDILNDYYKNKLTIKEIREKYDIGKSTVSKILKTKGLGGRLPQDYENHVYECDETFFEKIDTPEKAYWFGFIAADGNLYNKKLQICLASKDTDHLQKFCDRIGYSGPLYDDGTNKRLTISRIKIYNDLVALGIEADKTFKINENIFDSIPEHLIPAAMHGYFDGDGTFSKSGKNLQFGILGNEGFLSMFQQRLGHFGIFIKGPRPDRRTQRTFCCWLHIDIENVRLLKRFLYEDEFSSKDFLDRKKERLYAQAFVERLSFKLTHKNGEVYEGNNQREFARKIGVNYNSINQIIMGNRKSCKGWRVTNE